MHTTKKKRLIEQPPFICEASIAAHDSIKCSFFLAAKLSTLGGGPLVWNQKSDRHRSMSYLRIHLSCLGLC